MPRDIRTQILALMKSPRYAPLKRHELFNALKLDAKERTPFRKELKRLETERIVTCLRKNRFALAVQPETSAGRLRVHPDGYGLIYAGEEEDPRFYVMPEALANALSGDIVDYTPVAGRKRRVRGGLFLPPAAIRGILERPRSEVVGLLLKLPSYEYIIPDDKHLTANVKVRGYAPEINQVAPHHKVVVLLDPPDPGASENAGMVIEDLGHEDEPGVDILSIARRKGFRASHTAETTAAAERVVPLQEHGHARRDLRDRLIFTIDPADAKDYDDAVSLEETDAGFRLGVHIADVANYVAMGDPVDTEALLRGNSVYLVDRTIPMLPAHLTANICSLLPQVDRLTHTVDMLLDADGGLLHVETYPSIIHSKARLNYGEVQELIDRGTSDSIPPELHPTLFAMQRFSAVLRRLRMKEGSVGLTLPEVKCTLNERGETVQIGLRKEVEAYQLIEEFMLQANRAVAGLLVEAETPCIYRVHPAPDQDQWKRMGAELNALGIAKTPRSRAEINAIGVETSGTDIAYAAGTAILRNFKQALYAPTCDHHFGLAFDRYTHFTSPIRRYADLVVHRVLKAHEEGRSNPYTAEALVDVARQCSTCERAAMEAERESVDLKRVEYYMDLYRRNQRGPWHGIISAILPIGLIVELTDTLQRGLVHFSSLARHRLIVNKTNTVAATRDRELVFTIGDPVEVELIRVDEQRRQVDFKLADKKTHGKKSGRMVPKRGKRRRR
ncbi:MAG: VacB/RNase II family 3'-5' exoribonuclease [Kiritimatiellae bacterium]|nr:VacB/RNase II family 3'-5' exoribonuclease [Kiritimatiellia bacterium]